MYHFCVENICIGHQCLRETILLDGRMLRRESFVLLTVWWCPSCGPQSGETRGWTLRSWAGPWGEDRIFCNIATYSDHRYYYKYKIFEIAPNKRLVYKFGPCATGWKPRPNISDKSVDSDPTFIGPIRRCTKCLALFRSTEEAKVFPSLQFYCKLLIEKTIVQHFSHLFFYYIINEGKI